MRGKYYPLTEYIWFHLNKPQINYGWSVRYSTASDKAPLKAVVEDGREWGWEHGIPGRHLEWVWTPGVWEVCYAW